MTFQQQLWFSRGQSDASKEQNKYGSSFWIARRHLIPLRWYAYYAFGYNSQTGA